MKNVSNSILLIGCGRLAQHLTHWNSLLKSPQHLLTWNRRDDLALLQDRAQQASLIWLAISDSAIVSFYEQHLASLNIPVVHFSGAVYDARIGSAHPLMSFPHQLLANSVYPDIHFTITGTKDLQSLMPGFENSFSLLAAEDKSLYHALCVVSGNFPQLLWQQAFPQLKDLNIPDAAFEIYIRQITENFIQLKEKAVTGPLVRKDLTTIEKNQTALKDSPLEKIYRTFAEEFTK